MLDRRRFTRPGRRLRTGARARRAPAHRRRPGRTGTSAWSCRSRPAAASTRSAASSARGCRKSGASRWWSRTSPAPAPISASEFVARADAGRLHHADHRRRARGQPVPVPVDQLRPGRRLRAGHADLPVPEPAGGAEATSTFRIGRRHHRVRQGQPRQADLRIAGPRQLAAYERRAVQVHGQGRHHPRALSRRGAGLHRPDRRPRRHVLSR